MKKKKGKWTQCKLSVVFLGSELTERSQQKSLRVICLLPRPDLKITLSSAVPESHLSIRILKASVGSFPAASPGSAVVLNCLHFGRCFSLSKFTCQNDALDPVQLTGAVEKSLIAFTAHSGIPVM